MKPFLIQRAVFQDRENKTGLDSILRYDYMGSAEFEWGALPESLTNIRRDEDKYIYLTFTLNGKEIIVFCKKEQEPSVEEYLWSLIKGEVHLKEYSAFDYYIKGEGYFKDSVDLWWDIENHLMFWKKNDLFLSKFKGVIF